jgi:DNA-binding PadR family transcriptional regulator
LPRAKTPKAASINVISKFQSLTLLRTIGGDNKKTLARKKSKGTPLKVFSGREASLNRVIFLILYSKKLLAKYDMFLEIKNIKGLRHIDSKTVYRRMDALERQGWIAQKGNRTTKPGWPSELYELTLRGKAALKLDQKSLEEFLQTATDEQMLNFIDAFS